MLNYINADLYRIRRFIPRIIIFLLILAASIAYMIWESHHKSWNSVNFISDFTLILSLSSILLGFFELSAVFSEDFKAKTMQIAIGTGLSRPMVVLAKLLENAIVLLCDLALLSFGIFLFGAATDIRLIPEQMTELFSWIFCQWLSVILYVDIMLIPLFALQSAGALLILYFIVALDPIAKVLLPLLERQPFMASLHLPSYAYSNLLDSFRSQLILCRFSFAEFLGICIYFVLGYTAACLIFKRRELEF